MTKNALFVTLTLPIIVTVALMVAVGDVCVRVITNAVSLWESQ